MNYGSIIAIVIGVILAIAVAVYIAIEQQNKKS